MLTHLLVAAGTGISSHGSNRPLRTGIEIGEVDKAVVLQILEHMRPYICRCFVSLWNRERAVKDHIGVRHSITFVNALKPILTQLFCVRLAHPKVNVAVRVYISIHGVFRMATHTADSWQFL